MGYKKKEITRFLRHKIATETTEYFKRKYTKRLQLITRLSNDENKEFTTRELAKYGIEIGENFQEQLKDSEIFRDTKEQKKEGEFIQLEFF